jgi:hypothetical protein
VPGPPSVVALAGRRIDAAEAPERFPLRRCPEVAALIRDALIEVRAQVLVSSAACGADLLALDAAGVLGIRRRVILPFDAATFRVHSVTDRPGDWGALFDRILSEVDRAGDLVRLERQLAVTSAYQEVNCALLAEGAAMAAGSGAARVAMVVWEGHPRGVNDLTENFRREAIAGGWIAREVLTIAERQ